MIRGVRGATTIQSDTAEISIVKQLHLVEEMVKANNIRTRRNCFYYDFNNTRY